MAAGPSIRRAGPADLDRIEALERECFGKVDGAFSRPQLGRLLANRNAYWMLAADGQAVACWLTAGNGRARWARLYSLAVHPGLRGQGWARRLLDAGTAWMRAHGLAICRAEVRASNHGARRLYERFGFRELGRLPGYYGPGIDGLRLVLTLRPTTPPASHRTAAEAERRPRRRSRPNTRR